MKNAAAKSTVDMLHNIETIEKKANKLKLVVLNKLSSPGKKVIKLKGILNGVDISDKDITSALIKESP